MFSIYSEIDSLRAILSIPNGYNKGNKIIDECLHHLDKVQTSLNSLSSCLRIGSYGEGTKSIRMCFKELNLRKQHPKRLNVIN